MPNSGPVCITFPCPHKLFQMQHMDAKYIYLFTDKLSQIRHMSAKQLPKEYQLGTYFSMFLAHY